MSGAAMAASASIISTIRPTRARRLAAKRRTMRRQLVAGGPDVRSASRSSGPAGVTAPVVPVAITLMVPCAPVCYHSSRSGPGRAFREPNAGVEEHVQNVGDHEDHAIQNGDDEDQGELHGIIALEDTGHEVLPESVHAEEKFDEDRTGHHARQDGQ